MSNLMLASSCKDRLDCWKHALSGFADIMISTGSLKMILDDVFQRRPKVLLLDYDLIDPESSIGANILKRLSLQTKIIVLSDAIAEDVEWKLFKLGIRGYCQNSCNLEHLKQIVAAVEQGELWMRRAIACRIIDDIGSKSSKHRAYQASLPLLEKLTQREYDIAVRVGNGESNKYIAKECSITERTVKAHLTEIYKKLGITDRIQLALILSTDERLERRNGSP
jgi:two-component system nitrate/nitrite response regulator NarL